jgi:hypothetical protein
MGVCEKNCLMLVVTLVGISALSVYPGGASRAFSAISGIGTRATDCDDCSATVAMPFTFRFGTLALTSVVITSNGNVKLSADDESSDCCGGVPLDTSTFGYPRVAVQSTDLVATSATYGVWCRESLGVSQITELGWILLLYCILRLQLGECSHQAQHGLSHQRAGGAVCQRSHRDTLRCQRRDMRGHPKSIHGRCARLLAGCGCSVLGELCGRQWNLCQQ